MKLLPAFAVASTAFFGLLCFQFHLERTEPASSAQPAGELHAAEVEAADVIPPSPAPEVPPAPDAELAFVDEAELPVWGFSREAISIGPDVPESIETGPVTDNGLFDVSETVERVLAAPLRQVRVPTQRRIMSRAQLRPAGRGKVPFTVTVRATTPAWREVSPSLHAYAELTLRRTVRNKSTYQVRVHRGTGEVWVRQGEEWVAASEWLRDFDALTG